MIKQIQHGRFPGFEEEEGEGHFSGSREVFHQRNHRDISGQFPLYDFLLLETRDGNINAVIEPQPVDPRNSDKTARLFVKSESGDISVSFIQQGTNYLATFKNGVVERLDSLPAASGSEKDADMASLTHVAGDIPYRPYEVHISTKSGSIKGQYLFSTKALLSTYSGDIAVSLTPVASVDGVFAGAGANTVGHHDGHRHDHHTSLVTESASGSHHITLTEPLFIGPKGHDASYDRDAVEEQGSSERRRHSAKSVHITKSGNLDIEYPHSWAGNFTALYRSGSASLRGDGVKVTENTSWFAKGFKRPGDDEDEWWGARGDADLLLKTTSGSVNFHVQNRV